MQKVNGVFRKTSLKYLNRKSLLLSAYLCFHSLNTIIIVIHKSSLSLPFIGGRRKRENDKEDKTKKRRIRMDTET